MVAPLLTTKQVARLAACLLVLAATTVNNLQQQPSYTRLRRDPGDVPSSLPSQPPGPSDANPGGGGSGGSGSGSGDDITSHLGSSIPSIDDDDDITNTGVMQGSSSGSGDDDDSGSGSGGNKPKPPKPKPGGGGGSEAAAGEESSGPGPTGPYNVGDDDYDEGPGTGGTGGGGPPPQYTEYDEVNVNFGGKVDTPSGTISVCYDPTQVNNYCLRENRRNESGYLVCLDRCASAELRVSKLAILLAFLLRANSLAAYFIH